jgi:hypothetical protein
VLEYLWDLPFNKANLRYYNTLFDIPKIVEGSTIVDRYDFKEEAMHPKRTQDYKDLIKGFKGFVPMYFANQDLVGSSSRGFGYKPSIDRLIGSPDLNDYVNQTRTGPNTKFLRRRKGEKLGNIDTIVLDCHALNQDKNLLNIVKEGYSCLGIDWSFFDDYLKIDPKIYMDDNYSIEDLSNYDVIVVPDKYAKQRKVFRGNSIIQNLLAKVRNYVRLTHKRMPHTSFYNQPVGRSIVKQWTEGFPYSADASNFTTRFPIEVQQPVLDYLLHDVKETNEISGKQRTFSWIIHILLKGSKFKTPDGGYTTLGAGTGMGLFLSAELADMTHNILCAYLTYKATKGNNRFPVDTSVYIVNIDDVCFEDSNSTAALSYPSMMETLGVKINPNKGYKSDVLTNYRVSEYLKSIVVDGEYVSPHSLKLFSAVARSPSNIIMLDDLLNECEISDEGLQSILKSFYNCKIIRKGIYKDKFLWEVCMLHLTLYRTLKHKASEGYLSEETEIFGKSHSNLNLFRQFLELIRLDLVDSILTKFPGFEDHEIDTASTDVEFLRKVAEVSKIEERLFVIPGTEHITPRGSNAVVLLKQVLPRFRSMSEPDGLEFSEADFIEFDMSLFEISCETLEPDSVLFNNDKEFLDIEKFQLYRSSSNLTVEDRKRRSAKFSGLIIKLLKRVDENQPIYFSPQADKQLLGLP